MNAAGAAAGMNAAGAAATSMSATATAAGMSATTAAAAMTATAAAAAVTAATRRKSHTWANVFFIEDVKGRQTDVGDFLLGENNSPRIVL